MREFKFRFWDKDEKRFYTLVLDKQTKDIHFLMNYVCMQYTGIKDKNDKEIYEGDIVSGHDEDLNFICFGEVVWDKWECGFCVKGGEPTFIGCYPNLEVVGNIYENPELVK